jgi:hypothetical protein
MTENITSPSPLEQTEAPRKRFTTRRLVGGVAIASTLVAGGIGVVEFSSSHQSKPELHHIEDFHGQSGAQRKLVPGDHEDYLNGSLVMHDPVLREAGFYNKTVAVTNPLVRRDATTGNLYFGVSIDPHSGSKNIRTFFVEATDANARFVPKAGEPLVESLTVQGIGEVQYEDDGQYERVITGAPQPQKVNSPENSQAIGEQKMAMVYDQNFIDGTGDRNPATLVSVFAQKNHTLGAGKAIVLTPSQLQKSVR